jgi:hypothetical protein
MPVLNRELSTGRKKAKANTAVISPNFYFILISISFADPRPGQL